jgi:hypothetical protein
MEDKSLEGERTANINALTKATGWVKEKYIYSYIDQTRVI